MFFESKLICRHLDEPIGGEVAKEFDKAELIIFELFREYRASEIQEILGEKYSVLEGVIKGHLDAKKQRFLGFRMAHNDVFCLWQNADKSVEPMSLDRVCGIKLNDIAAFIAPEYKKLLSRADELYERFEKFWTTKSFLLNTGLQEVEIDQILTDKTNPYIGWLYQFISTMKGRGIKYVGNQSKYICVFQENPKYAYREKFMDLALNWRTKIFPVLSKLTKRFHFINEVKSALARQKPQVTKIVVDIMEGRIISEFDQDLLFLELGGYVDGLAKGKYGDNQSDLLPETDEAKLDRLLVDPELRELNKERELSVAEKLRPDVTSDEALELRLKLAEHLRKIAAKDPNLMKIADEVINVLPEVENFIVQVAADKNLLGMEILAKVFDNYKQLFARMDEMDKNSANEKPEVLAMRELWIKTFVDIIAVKILSTGAKRSVFDTFN